MIPVAVLCLVPCFASIVDAPIPSLLSPASCQPAVGDDKVLKAIDAWLKAYRAGKVDFGSRDDVGKGSIAEKFGVMPKGLLGAITPKRELEVLLEQAVALESTAAAELVLTVAAIGLDHGSVKYKPEMVPFAVRATGEAWLAKFQSPAALEFIAKVARGEQKIDKTYGAGQRAAAIRLLGTRKDDSARTLCEQQLRAAELPLRLAAAEALAALGDEHSGEALAGALLVERSDVVVGALCEAMRACFAPYLLHSSAPQDLDQKPATRAPKDDKDPKAAPAADATSSTDAAAAAATAAKEPSAAALAGARAAIGALGRTNWRGDMQLLQFLSEFRTMEAVPALIGILQRFKDHPEEIQSGVLSSLLLHRAHEMLVAMTGAVFLIDAPEKWTEFWQHEQQKLLAAPRVAAPAARPQQTVAGFCGIPVEGNRVLFIIDLSHSMEFAMRPRPGDTTADPSVPVGSSRLKFAQAQLHGAIAAMPETDRLNFITFNGRTKAEVWNKDLVVANAKNKALAAKFVTDMVATYKVPTDGGTNLWSGLEEGLKMKTLVYGDRDEQTVDEIFVVSDGAPSVGEIVDPVEILRLVGETNRFTKIRINTIFITSPNDQDPKNLSLKPNEFMRRMAEQNGGKFVEFNN